MVVWSRLSGSPYATALAEFVLTIFQVTEAGASNFFIVWTTKEGKMQLITAPLDDKIILDGVTRRSVLELARERFVAGSKYLDANLKAVEVVERTFTMAEVLEAKKDDRLIEAFVSGTAVSLNLSPLIFWVKNSDEVFSTSSLRFPQSVSKRKNFPFRWAVEKLVILLGP